MSDGVNRRRYDATGRRERARHTRLHVVAVAKDLFVQRGYTATKMSDVAAAAGVSVELLYSAFGSKPALLKTVFDVTIAGDDTPVPVMDRPELLAVRAEPDPVRACACTHASSRRPPPGPTRCTWSCSQPPAATPSWLASPATFQPSGSTA